MTKKKMNIGVYGKWFLKIDEEVVEKSLENNVFPDGDFEIVRLYSGDGNETFDDLNERTIKLCKEKGANYVMIGHGDKCSVYTIDGECLAG